MNGVFYCDRCQNPVKTKAIAFDRDHLPIAPLDSVVVDLCDSCLEELKANITSFLEGKGASLINMIDD